MKAKRIIVSIVFTLLLINISSISVFANSASYQMHTVKSGDTFWSISHRYNKNIATLQSVNKFNIHNLQVGDMVIVNTIKPISVNVNGNKVNFDRQPYIEENRVFVPLRFIAEALNVDDVKWIQETSTAQIFKDGNIIEVVRGSDIAKINGKSVKLDAPVKLYIDRTYVPVRFFAEALGVENINWDANQYIVNIGDKINNNNQQHSYSQEELDWLAKIIHAEAEAEPYAGKLAVANVIINRKNSNEFPNTIKGVVFDDNYGIQFTPVANHTIYNEPNEDSYKAAKEALEGNNNIGNSLFFLNPDKSVSYWIMYNRQIYTKIGEHVFYL